MANVQINADTVNKTTTVSIDGVNIPNVRYASVYTYTDGGIEVSIDVSEELSNGVTKRISYYASGSEKAKELIASKADIIEDLTGFVGVEQPQETVEAQIEAYLLGQRR